MCGITTSAYEALLFKKDGKDLLVHLNKSGFVFVLDKNTGTLENIWRLSQTINFVKDIDSKSGELIGRVEPPMGKSTLICPSALARAAGTAEPTIQRRGSGTLPRWRSAAP